MPQRNRISLNSVIRRDGIRCHYCDIICERSKDGSDNRKNVATREHVVPSSLGGANALYNIVVACKGCNNKRGNSIRWCFCDFCEAAYAQNEIDKFDRIINFNYNKIWKTTSGRWLLRYQGKIRSFKRFELAVAELDKRIKEDYGVRNTQRRL